MVQEDNGVGGYETRNDLESRGWGWRGGGADRKADRQVQVKEGSELEGGLRALGTQISAPPWLCDPGHVSSPLWASMDWFRILPPLCTALSRIGTDVLVGLGPERGTQ